MNSIYLERLGPLSPKQEAEAQRYQTACELLISELQNIAEDNNVCPWCLLAHVGHAVRGAMESGDIEHEAQVMEH